MKNAVIIGAGQTGRGFIAPILVQNNYHITFLDKDEKLIEKMNQEGKYKISYFSDVKESITIDQFEAYSITSNEAVEKIRSSDIVCTSVFSNHLSDLIPIFKESEKNREKPLQIACCENGVNVKKDLVEAQLNAVITEGIIFCTTLRPSQDSLDLLCEDINELPIDASPEGLDFHVDRMPLEPKFNDLIQRKIYTYNFMSAVVSYLGWYKGYEVYGEAANDEDIDNVIQHIKPVVSKVIGKKYNVPYEEQLTFTQRAVNKFQNKSIIDTIYRNARQAKRKLGINERLLSPLRFTVEQGEDITWMEPVTAAAIVYAKTVEDEDITSVYDDLSTFLPKSELEKIKNLQNKFEENIPLSKILQTL